MSYCLLFNHITVTATTSGGSGGGGGGGGGGSSSSSSSSSHVSCLGFRHFRPNMY
jgi:hypothetical protein